MFNLYKQTHEYIQSVQPGDVFVEIGSSPTYKDGSSWYYGNLAQTYNTVLHTVDINNNCPNRITHSAINWYVDFGSKWCAEYARHVGKKIACLYLDNFDYIWDVNNIDQFIQKQIDDYRTSYNVEMNNRACQIEHMKQMVALLPWMADQSVIILDDTYLLNECWVGKCGPVVVYLQTQGYKILAENTDLHAPQPRKFEVILRR